ncbi:tRNA preQ1(34) S-adenosylmethionine ribosyltransferase-isomerase QueA [Acidobacteriota bacterium]
MLVSDFDYHLPQELIAQKPLPRRDSSRMMVLNRKTGDIIHSQFQHFPDHLHKGDVLVLNNSKVIPARVWGKKEDADIEFLFLSETQKGVWEVLCRPAKKVQVNDAIIFSKNLAGKVVGTGTEGKRSIVFETENVIPELKKIGYAPLPPYIKRTKLQTDTRDIDLERYQTVFAEKEGSIAAPTAGLHFTPEMLQTIMEKGIAVAEICLDVGLATFQPVRVNNVEEHEMLTEGFSVSPKVARAINSAKRESRPVVAVGTTTVRTLESAAQKIKPTDTSENTENTKKNIEVKSGPQTTDLFIYPGFDYKITDRLLTNFHLPQSTLLMLVSAFAGKDFIMKAYREAVSKKYRFFSYGDCMLIL